jgi:putative transposase
MPSTHFALYYHLVFTTKYHLKTIDPTWRYHLHSYMGGLVRKSGGVAIAVGGVEDHVHLLVSLGPTHRLSDVLRDVKCRSSRWAHTEIGLPNFRWQEGYGAFSVSRSLAGVVQRYIQRQEEHHRVRSFREEYIGLLRRHGVDFDPGSLW